MNKLVLEKGSTYSRRDLNNYIVDNDGLLIEINRPINVMPDLNQQLEIIEIYTEVGSTERNKTYHALHSRKNVVIITKSI